LRAAISAPIRRGWPPGTRAILIGLHRVADEGDLALQAAVGRRLEIGQRREIDDLGVEPLRAGRSGIPQRGDHQLLRERAEDRRAFLAAHPDRHLEGLDMDILEAERLELLDCPRAPTRLGRGRG